MRKVISSTFFVCGVLLIITSAFFYVRQWQDDNIVDAYIDRNSFSSLSISKDSAVMISQQLRADFNIDHKKFTALDYSSQPFLRHSMGFLLTHLEGLCGEGTRVLVGVLDKLGYDATRITLYDRYLTASHTLVSVVLNGEEFFVDSINTREENNRFLNDNNISTRDFQIIGKGHGFGQQKHKRAEYVSRRANWQGMKAKFFERFKIYSYEALPYDKLLRKLGLQLQIFNFSRPPRFISILAEKPYLLSALLVFGAGLTCLLSAFLINRKARNPDVVR